jgi:hypothetical protein
VPLFGAAIFLVISAASEARAQGFISPFLGFNFGGDTGALCPSVTNCEDKRRNWGVGFGTMGKAAGFEEEFSYTQHFFGETPNEKSSVITLMSNFMLAPKLGPVRPYGLLGLGLMKAHVELSPTTLLSFTNNTLGWDIGGGLMVFFGSHFGVRGDIRYFHSFQTIDFLGTELNATDAKLDFGRASAAAVFAF